MRLLERMRAALWSVPVGLQLSVLYTLLLTGTLTLLGAVLYTQQDHFLVQDASMRLQQSAARLLTKPAPKHPGKGSDVQPPADINKIATDLVRGLSGPDVAVAVFDLQGTVITSTQSVGEEYRPTLPNLSAEQISKATETYAPEQWVLTDSGGGRRLIVLMQVTSAGTLGNAGSADNSNTVSSPSPSPSLSLFPSTPYLLLEQSASLAAADAALNQLRFYLVLGIIVGTLLGVLAGMTLTRMVLRPLDRMASTAEAIASGDLKRRLRLPSGKNEIARLGGAFDHMVGRLTATLDAQRRFVADASHEMRTPLTLLDGLAEILMIGAHEGDTQFIEESAHTMHGEVGRMSRLVADLLTLSKLDSMDGAAKPPLAPVDVCRVLAEVVEQMKSISEARHVRLVLECACPLWAMSETDRLKQVVLNLIDNALRYTPQGGEIRVRATDGRAGSLCIQVEDTGSGIAPDDLPHIFDRFYRGDPSRTRSTGNSGLGLSIARSIVESQGGTIAAASKPGEGACFTVTLTAGRTSN